MLYRRNCDNIKSKNVEFKIECDLLLQLSCFPFTPPLPSLQSTLLIKLTCAESRLVASIAAVVVVITICRRGDALEICARKFAYWTLLVDTRWLLELLRLFYAVDCCCGIAQVKYDDIDFLRVHFLWHFISLSLVFLLAFVLRLILYCFEHFLSYNNWS